MTMTIRHTWLGWMCAVAVALVCAFTIAPTFGVTGVVVGTVLTGLALYAGNWWATRHPHRD